MWEGQSDGGGSHYSPATSDPLETLLQRLLPTPVVPTLPPKPVSMELERMLQRLLLEVQTPKPTPPAKSGITDLETLLQGLLPGIPGPTPRARPGPIRRDWATIVCFSCGKAGHRVDRCPELNERFPFMLPEWSAEKVGDSYVMILPRVTAGDWGSAARRWCGASHLPPECGCGAAGDSADSTFGDTTVW